MLRKTLYPKFEPLIHQVATNLIDHGITPNQLTLGGLVLNFLAGVIFAKGYLFLGTLILLGAALGDLLDGPVARISKNVTKFGAFLDSAVDRYSDFFIFGGISLYFIQKQQPFWGLISFGIILGAFVVSYAKARAENFIEDCEIGIFGRAERIVLLAIGTLFHFILPFLLPLVLLTLFFGTHWTAIQRILYTRKSLTETAEK